MKNSSVKYYLYLTWPRYLAQWYAHEVYRVRHYDDEHLEPFIYNCDLPPRDLLPVETVRGSAERNVLEMCLTKQLHDYPEKISDDTTIKLVIPFYLNKDPRTYNYLLPKSRALLESTVRNHLRFELNKFILKMNPMHQISVDECLTAFMEMNGIEYTETNLLSLRQLWFRMKNAQRMARKRKEGK